MNNDTIVIIMVALTALVAISAFVLAILAAIWRIAGDIMTALDKVVYMMSIDSPIPMEGHDNDDGND